MNGWVKFDGVALFATSVTVPRSESTGLVPESRCARALQSAGEPASHHDPGGIDVVFMPASTSDSSASTMQVWLGLCCTSQDTASRAPN